MNRSILLWASLSCVMAACEGVEGELPPDDSAEISRASQPLQDGGRIQFRNFKSRKCIGVDGGSRANGALLKQFPCANAPIPNNQVWESRVFSVDGLLVNELTNTNRGAGGARMCMGVDGASTRPGANIAQFNCGNGAPNQLWLSLDGRLINVKSGLCIGVDGASVADGAQLKQFSCGDLRNPPAQNQTWLDEPR